MNKDLEARIRKEGLNPADFQKAWDKVSEYCKELMKRREECKKKWRSSKAKCHEFGIRAWTNGMGMVPALQRTLYKAIEQ